MANALATGGTPGNAAATPPAAPSAAPGGSDLADRLARAEAARDELIRHNQFLQSHMAGRPPAGPPAPAAPPAPDPFKTMTEEMLTADPSKSLERLDAGTRMRIRQEIAPVIQEIRKEIFGVAQGVRTENSFDVLFATNPDIAADKEGFAGAMARSAVRANAAGIPNPSPAQLLPEAVKIYREGKPAPAPVLEPAGGSSMPSLRSDKPAGPSLYEKWYGKSDDDEIHEEEWDPKKATEEYADARNEDLIEHGANFGEATMAQENAERNRRKAAKKAGG